MKTKRHLFNLALVCLMIANYSFTSRTNLNKEDNRASTQSSSFNPFFNSLISNNQIKVSNLKQNMQTVYLWFDPSIPKEWTIIFHSLNGQGDYTFTIDENIAESGVLGDIPNGSYSVRCICTADLFLYPNVEVNFYAATPFGSNHTYMFNNNNECRMSEVEAADGPGRNELLFYPMN